MKKRLAVVTTHPIQYYAPYFKLLNQRSNIDLKVFYTWGEEVLDNKYDPGFKKIINWDIPLLEGYEFEFADNIAKYKGSHHFRGIKNPDLITKINEWKPDAVLIIGWSYHAHLMAMRYFHNKIPIIFRGDSTLLDEKPGLSLKKLIRQGLLTWVYKHIDIALYVGENNKKYYQKFGVADKKLVYAPHAIDNDRFADKDGKYTIAAGEWRQTLGIPENDTVFLFAGKLESKKDPGLLIEAFGRMNNSRSHLVIVGNGVLEEELKSKAAAYSNIHFLDFQNQSRMPVIYRLCDIFVLPSRGPDETWGLAINEAMASGKAVIASDKCGGAIDLIENGVNGFVFKNQDINSLGDAMARLMEPAVLEQMGNSSYHRICSFSFGRIAESIEQVVEKA